MASLPDVEDDDDDVMVIHGDGADQDGGAGEDVSAAMRSVPGVLPVRLPSRTHACIAQRNVLRADVASSGRRTQYLPTTTGGASAPPARPPALSFAGGAAVRTLSV